MRKRRPKVGAIVTDTGRVVCERCELADRALPRMRGLLGRDDLPQGEGLLLSPAGSVHTFFMRFPIDVVFLDRDLVVQRVAAAVPRSRLVWRRRARRVLELPAGSAHELGVHEGSRLEWRPLHAAVAGELARARPEPPDAAA